MGQLEEQIKVVAEAREEFKKVAAAKAVSHETWEHDNLELLIETANKNQTVLDAEVKLRELTLKAYAETGDKYPAIGVGIRKVLVIDYDKKLALDWAKSHDMALMLDKKAFEKIVKADTPDFVKITTEAQATISANLTI